MTLLTVGIADDEAPSRMRLRHLLAAHPDVAVAWESENGRDTVRRAVGQPVELLLLDIRMPGLDGFGVVRHLGAALPPAVVFVTAFDDHAVRAFDANAIDYLMKPVAPERLSRALARVRTRLGESRGADALRRLVALVEPAGDRHGAGPLERIQYEVDGRIRFAAAHDVDWIEAAGNYVRIHLGREAHLVRASLRTLEQELDPARFVRIHRSAIVNVDRIASMELWGSGDYTLHLRDGTRLRLSRHYRERFDRVTGKLG